MELASEISRNVAAALAEDVGACDWTACLLPADQVIDAHVICREPAVICGQPWFKACLHSLDAGMEVRWLAAEGASVAGGSRVCELRGRARAILTGERVALNFLQLLSAVATVTRRYVTLGTDGYGRSDTRAALRDFFEVSRTHIAVATLKALADEGALKTSVVADAIARYGIKTDTPDPWDS